MPGRKLSEVRCTRHVRGTGAQQRMQRLTSGVVMELSDHMRMQAVS